MYGISAYGSMVADERRTAAYELALQRTIRPESVVLDIGCGSGIMSVLACRAGARRVYGIEPDDVIEVAREIARANGYQDRVRLIQDLSTNVELPERVDILVSDLRGVLPLFQRHIPSIVDARQRLLKPGGIQIPKQDTLWFVPVTAPQIFQKMRAGWEQHGHGLDLNAGLRHATNAWRKERGSREQFLAEPQPWAVLDYQTIEAANVSGEATWTATQEGIGHGFQLWFDATLYEDIGYSNAPWEPELIYSNAFFPWTEAVAIAPGDAITVHLAADLVGNDYVWRWKTRVATHAGQVKASFQQSTFFGVPLSLHQLQRQASDYVPILDRDGEIDRMATTLMDGKNTLEEIARQLAAAFPDRFRDWQEALSRVGDLSRKYSR